MCTVQNPAEIMEELLAQYPVPEEKEMLLYTYVRLAHGFSDYTTRLKSVQARLQALSVLIYSNQLTDSIQVWVSFVCVQGCRSRGFWLESEPKFSPGSGSYSYSTQYFKYFVFMGPKYDDDDDNDDEDDDYDDDDYDSDDYDSDDYDSDYDYE